MSETSVAHDPNSPEEIFAKAFAYELLMPEADLRLLIKLGMPFKGLCDRLLVEPHVLRERLRDLGLNAK